MEKQILWNILNGKCSMLDAIKYFGASKKDADEIMEEIKNADKDDSMNYLITGQQLSKRAYNELVELGEIDKTEIFNLATCSSDGKGSHGDIGFCADKIYRYEEGWQPWFYWF